MQLCFPLAEACAGLRGDGCAVAVLDTGESRAAAPCAVHPACAARSSQPPALLLGLTHSAPSNFFHLLSAGADYTKPDLGSCAYAGAPAPCRVAFAKDFTAADDGRLDADRWTHGTNVASIIAKMAPGVKILALVGGGPEAGRRRLRVCML